MEMALHQLRVQVEKAPDQQWTARGVFFDTEGMLNNTSYDSKCAALFKQGVDYTIIQWIKATLEGHLAAATLGGFSKTVAVSSRV